MSSTTPAGHDACVEVEKLDGMDVVRVRGDLDIFGFMAVRRVLLDAAVCSQGEVVLDLREVSFMDSVGVGAIVAGHRRVTARSSRLSVVCPPGAGRNVLAVSGVDKVLLVFPSMRDAMTALSADDAP